MGKDLKIVTAKKEMLDCLASCEMCKKCFLTSGNLRDYKRLTHLVYQIKNLQKLLVLFDRFSHRLQVLESSKPESQKLSMTVSIRYMGRAIMALFFPL